MGDQASSHPGYSHARNNNQDGYRGLSNSNKQALYQGANVLGSANDPDSNAKSAPGILERVHATLDTIQDNVSRFEKGIHTPAAFKLGFSANGFVSWAAIDDPQLLHAAAGRIDAQRSDVDHSQPRAVVGLVGSAINDEMVVVDGLHGALVSPRKDGLRQIGHVDDVRRRVLIRSRASFVHLI